MNLRGENLKMVGKLAVVTAGMFCFGYALVPIYKAICEMTGINILSISETQVPGNAKAGKAAEVLRNSQVDTTRTITVEFDANVRGPWEFKPEKRSMQVHPGELSTVMYEFQNVQNRRMAAQAIPSYAPRNAANHFNKLECFCFNQYTLEPGEKKSWPVACALYKRCCGRLSDFARIPSTSKTLKSSTLSTSLVWPSVRHCCLFWA